MEEEEAIVSILDLLDLWRYREILNTRPGLIEISEHILRAYIQRVLYSEGFKI